MNDEKTKPLFMQFAERVQWTGSTVTSYSHIFSCRSSWNIHVYSGQPPTHIIASTKIANDMKVECMYVWTNVTMIVWKKYEAKPGNTKPYHTHDEQKSF